MALFTVDCNFYPQQPLFRYFYFVTGRDTVVRNKKQVVFPENLRVVFQNIVDAQIEKKDLSLIVSDLPATAAGGRQIGRASCRERV